ncbi:DUF6578 domain-containing protein [Massiliimalia timonensis]|uniref:DUF6578 domain-containing protein n=1 Tax=Massiliimalia timonensis TaxID=1987501 RepID=UPI002D219E16|nr:DUF6578 domain-containing protein [Massiliimalia timonensis]
MKCVVFYECWQMECCGTPFSIGDRVKWLVTKPEYFKSPIDIGKIDYLYEAHSSEWEKIAVLEGTVEHIRILYERYAPSEDNARLLVPVDGELIKVENAKGFDNQFKDMEAGGYVVSFNQYTIRPAKREEVTFR